MLYGIFHLIYGACTSIFLLKGYNNRTCEVKGVKLGNDKGAFLKLYFVPYERFCEKFPRADYQFYFRLAYPTVIGFFVWALGLGLYFWLIPIGSLVGELIHFYKSNGKEKTIVFLQGLIGRTKNS